MHDMSAVVFYYTVICGHLCVGYTDLDDTSNRGLLRRDLLCYVFVFAYVLP